MRKSAATTWILLPMLLACAAISVTAGEVSADASEGKFLLDDPQLQECWASFFLIPECIDDVFKSFVAGTIVGIGPACCKVINKFADKCFPKFAGVYPVFNPIFAPIVKAHCQKPPSPAPISSSPLV